MFSIQPGVYAIIERNWSGPVGFDFHNVTATRESSARLYRNLVALDPLNSFLEQIPVRATTSQYFSLSYEGIYGHGWNPECSAATGRCRG